MRLLFVVQRYGDEVAGGAETLAREFAVRLARRGHTVEVLTSCALDYTTWADDLAPGTAEEHGVVVHRLGVDRERDPDRFSAISGRVFARPAGIRLERDWVAEQGPSLPELPGWIEARAASFDLAIFFTYLYETTTAGVPAAAGRVPVLLHPTAHAEPPLDLHTFRRIFPLVDSFGFLTPEEEDLVRTRFAARQPSVLTGVGSDPGLVGDGGRFRASHGLGERPVLLYLGRIDPSKGTDELIRFVARYRERHGADDPALVVAGAAFNAVGAPEADGVVVTGYLSERDKLDAIAAATIFVQPSYFESFSIALSESWVQRRPALVQGRCAVLRGQVVRSGGGLAYHGFAEFEAALDMLLADPALRDRLGRAGRAYVERSYDWEVVIDRYERFLVEQARPAPTADPHR